MISACPICNGVVDSLAARCHHCGVEFVRQRQETTTSPQVIHHYIHHGGTDRSSLAAGCLALALGPVGLWYKGQWAAGFAWLVMTVLLSAATGLIAAPFCWLGMAVHAIMADTK